MGQLQLGVGTRYERDGQAWVVVQVVRDGRLVVENQNVGGQEVVRREDLTAAWAAGVLRFAVRGRGARVEGEGTLPTRYMIADVHDVPEAERAEAWRRYRLIAPLLEWAPEARTRQAIKEYLSSPVDLSS